MTTATYHFDYFKFCENLMNSKEVYVKGFDDKTCEFRRVKCKVKGIIDGPENDPVDYVIFDREDRDWEQSCSVDRFYKSMVAADVMVIEEAAKSIKH